MQRFFLLFTLALVTIAAVAVGLWMGDEKPAPASSQRSVKKAVVPRSADRDEPPVSVDVPEQLPPVELPAAIPRNLDDMIAEKDVNAILQLWAGSRTLADRQVCAKALAIIGTPESVEALLSQLLKLFDPVARKSIAATSLGSLSSTEALPNLFNVLAKDSKNHSGLVEEVITAVGRLAQSDTADSLGALHRQVSSQPALSGRVLQAISGIRTESALPGLLRLAKSADQDKSAATAALSAMNVIGGSRSNPNAQP
jgi:HEAT repeat protein